MHIVAWLLLPELCNSALTPLCRKPYSGRSPILEGPGPSLLTPVTTELGLGNWWNLPPPCLKATAPFPHPHNHTHSLHTLAYKPKGLTGPWGWLIRGSIPWWSAPRAFLALLRVEAGTVPLWPYPPSLQAGSVPIGWENSLQAPRAGKPLAWHSSWHPLPHCGPPGQGVMSKVSIWRSTVEGPLYTHTSLLHHRANSFLKVGFSLHLKLEDFFYSLGC